MLRSHKWFFIAVLYNLDLQDKLSSLDVDPIQNKVDNLGSIINSQQATLANQQSAIDGMYQMKNSGSTDFISISLVIGVTKNLKDTSNDIQGKLNGIEKCINF